VSSLVFLVVGIWSDAIDDRIRSNGVEIQAVVLILLGWALALAIIARFWLAVFSWKSITPRRTRRYLLIWSGATLCFVALGILSRPWADFYRLEHLYILAALLLFPFARLGLAPLSLEKNRHR